jgi:hypothetical protein
MNQTYNAVLNYGNRNAQSEVTVADIGKGYAAALGSSIAVSVGLRKGFSGVTSRLTGGRLVLMNSFVAFVASACAGFCNLVAMRQSEMIKGIKVFDKDDNELGISVECGKKAVIQTGLSRMVLPITPIFLPGAALYLFERAKLYPKAGVGRMIFETGIIMTFMYYAIPISCSIFS